LRGLENLDTRGQIKKSEVYVLKDWNLRRRGNGTGSTGAREKSQTGLASSLFWGGQRWEGRHGCGHSGQGGRKDQVGRRLSVTSLNNDVLPGLRKASARKDRIPIAG